MHPKIYREMIARPERLEELVAESANRTIVIDEIQRVPTLFNVVHRLMEQRPDLRFVLTGSSARKLRRGGVDLLAGRALNKSLHPFMAAELPSFHLEDALRFGMLPLVRAADDPRAVLDAYLTLYMDEEVKGIVRNIGGFARFLEAAALAHASVLSVSSVARDCEIGRRTVQGYFEVLEDLLLAFRVPVFRKRARRRSSVHPKFYFFDPGVFRSIRPKGPLDAPGEIDGQALEGLVAEHLRGFISYSGFDMKLYYHRTRGGLEVDFVLYGGDGFHAIEVKNRATIRPQDLRALRAFAEDYPECTTALLCRGKERFVRNGVLCLPVDEFLRDLVPGKPLPVGQGG